MDKPGIITRIKVTGIDYDDLRAQADEHFAKFYDNTEYTIVGAEIQPGEMSQGMGPPEVLTWSGMFYSMPQPKVSVPNLGE